MRRVNGFAKSKRASSAAWSAGKRVRARLRKGDEGNALVEFALILPVLMLILMGIFVVGIIFNQQMVLTHAVGTGADLLQQLSSNAPLGSGTDPCALATAQIDAASAGVLIPGNIHVDYHFNGADVGTSCTNDLDTAPDGTQGGQLTVTATYTCNFVVVGYHAPNCTLSATNSVADSSSIH